MRGGEGRGGEGRGGEGRGGEGEKAKGWVCMCVKPSWTQVCQWRSTLACLAKEMDYCTRSNTTALDRQLHVRRHQPYINNLIKCACLAIHSNFNQETMLTVHTTHMCTPHHTHVHTTHMCTPHTCTHTHTCTQAHTYTHTHTHTYTPNCNGSVNQYARKQIAHATQTQTRAETHTHTHTQTHAYTHTCIHVQPTNVILKIGTCMFPTQHTLKVSRKLQAAVVGAHSPHQ